jgi:mono/diheme cytochrome c family protein
MIVRLLAALLISGAVPGAAQVNITPTVAQSLRAGSETFTFYCASCHGRGGKGDGPAAPALATKPPNLTTLAARNRGLFPAARVKAFIAGGPVTVPAHGSSEMPVWGPIFKVLDPSDTLADARIENVVAYIQSIQVRR